MEGKVVSINRSKNKGEVKTPIIEGFFITNFGLEGDGHAELNSDRQVTFLDVETIEEMKNSGIYDLKPGMIAENITTSNIKLYDFPVGTKLKVGNVMFEITKVGKKCDDSKKCSLKIDIDKCLAKSRIVFAKVLENGTILKDDRILMLD